MKKILVVDDERDTCDFVKGFFEERGFQVLMAQSGAEALNIVRAEKPDVVLLDIKMKQMNGIETLKKIREKNKNVKVIMVTAVEDQDKIDIAHTLGVCKYITKPLILDELASSVTACMKES